MTEIRTRQDLLNWLGENAPSATIARGLRPGHGYSVLLLGAFKPLPDSSFPGWIVRVSSPIRAYHAAVSIRPDGRLNAYMVGHIDWKAYDGDRSNLVLYQGDKPDRATLLKRVGKFENLGVNDAHAES